MNPEPLLSELDAATFLGKSRPALRQMRLRGRGPQHCIVGGAIMYRPSWLEEFINDNTVPARPYVKQSSRSSAFRCFHCGGRNSEIVQAQTTVDSLRLRMKCSTCTYEYDLDARVLANEFVVTEKTTDIDWGF